jgi:hypothetical protein
VDAASLAERYPALYHMAEDGSWLFIQRHGLLSTSALLDLFEVGGEERLGIESRRRPEVVKITHPERGVARIRDNKPMQDGALEKSLSGMSVAEWYENLNRRAFFWGSWKRLEKLLGAKAYRDRAHLVLEVDTASLLATYALNVSLSPINSGATFAMGPALRGPGTFRRIENHPEERGVVELAVDYAVPDIFRHTFRVTRRRAGEEPELVYGVG